MIVLDTHAWIWWVNQPDQLSPAVLHRMREVSERNPVLVSSISVWEVHMLVKKGRLGFRTDPLHWIHQCERSQKIRFLPIDNEIARMSVQLPDSVPEDPADRLIIATALSLGAILITKDRKIRASRTVETLW